VIFNGPDDVGWESPEQAQRAMTLDAVVGQPRVREKARFNILDSSDDLSSVFVTSIVSSFRVNVRIVSAKLWRNNAGSGARS
jgi:hypothetical protein